MSSIKTLKKVQINIYLIGLILVIFFTTSITYSKYIKTHSDNISFKTAYIDKLKISEDPESKNVILLPGVNQKKKVYIHLNDTEKDRINEIPYYIFLDVSVESKFSWKLLGNNNYTFMLDYYGKGDNGDNLKDISWAIDQYKEDGRENWTFLKKICYIDNNLYNHYIYYDFVESGEVFKDKNIIKDGEIKVLSCVTRSLLEKYSSKILGIKFSAVMKQYCGEDVFKEFEDIKDYLLNKKGVDQK